MRGSLVRIGIGLGLGLGLGSAGCEAALDQRLAIVHDPRVLAIVAEPAEALPNTPVTYTALVASPDGPVAATPSWAFCIAPKPPTEDDVVVPGCLAGDQIVSLGTAPTVTGTLPKDGCLLFGPDTPPGGFRPRGADASGGYYQPVRAVVGDADAFGLSRITCKLPNAPADASRDYQTMYMANANPTLLPLALADASGAVVAATAVPADADVTLTAAWPAEAAEAYVSYDPGAEKVVPRREAMRVSWFATDGALPVDASAVDEPDATSVTRVTTTWHTPAAPGAAWLWLVLRDSRGGIATQEIAITVR